MRRLETRINLKQICFLPSLAFIHRTTGIYVYKYRIGFAWLIFYASIGFGKVK